MHLPQDPSFADSSLTPWHVVPGPDVGPSILPQQLLNHFTVPIVCHDSQLRLGLSCRIRRMFRGSHELGTHWVFYTLRENFIDVCTSLIVQVPSKDVIQRIKFTRMT